MCQGFFNSLLGSLTDSGAILVGVLDCSIAWADYDGDGRLDLVVGGMSESGRVTRLYRNEGTAVNDPPTAPSELAAEVDGLDITFSWLAASDAETPAPGLSYNLRVGSSPGSDDVSSGMADPTSGARRVPRIGNAQKRTSWSLKGLEIGIYFASVQAIDTAFAGSSWSDEITFAIVGSETGALYAIASGSHAGELYRVSRVDATATLIGNTGVPFQSLAYDPFLERLLTVNDATGELTAIHPADASITTVLDETGSPILIPAGTMTGLAVNPHERVVYGVDEQEMLFRISLLTGIVESVGSVGFDRILGLGIDPVSGTIYGYFEPDGNDFLITIDATTGQGTIIGSTGINDADGLTFDPTRGTLFTRDRSSDRLFEIDPLTGSSISVGPMPAFGVWGFAVAHNVGGPNDCNVNGVLDAQDIASGTSQDSNANGIPDECEENETPVCDAAGPYVGECAGATTAIQLDGTGSSDPDDDALTFAWTTDCPGGVFDDDTSATPTLTADSVAACSLTCSVFLTVDDGRGETADCDATVTIEDTTAPTITCPGDMTVECDGAGNTADLAGWLNSATGSDNCADVTITNDFTGTDSLLDSGA